MTPDLPWTSTPQTRRRLMLSVAAIGSALSADPAVHLILGQGSHLDGLNQDWTAHAITVSTGLWTLVFASLMGRLRSGWHFLWLGPILGALNAGTSLALVTLSNGDGVAEAAGGLIAGTLFGTALGGGPLGLVFGLALALYLTFARAVCTDSGIGSPHQLLAGSAVWLSGVATLSLLVDARNTNGAHWPALTLLLLATGLAGWTLFQHLRASRWIRRARAGELDSYLLVGEDDKPSEVRWRDRTMAGPFRTSDQQESITFLPARPRATLAAQAMGAFVTTAISWAALGLA